jgi:acetyl esterase/lipase
LPEFGSDRIVIGGESAGAHLSAVSLLRLRDKHGFSGFRGAALTYGCYDMTMTPSMARWGPRNLILSTPIVAWFIDNFVPEGDRRQPDISPLYADLAAAAALFSVGSYDPLLDDTLFMQGRWLAASVRKSKSIRRHARLRRISNADGGAGRKRIRFRPRALRA